LLAAELPQDFPNFAANIPPAMWADLMSKTAARVAPKMQSSDGI
jgi:hypothetical protein